MPTLNWKKTAEVWMARGDHTVECEADQEEARMAKEEAAEEAWLRKVSSESDTRVGTSSKYSKDHVQTSPNAFGFGQSSSL